MLRVILHLFIVGAVLGRPNPEMLMQKIELAFLANVIEKSCKEFTNIIRDTSLTKEQRVDKVKQTMLGDAAEDERKAAIEIIDPSIDLNDWMVKLVATAPVKVQEVYNKVHDMRCDLLKMTPDERMREVEQTLFNITDDVKKELEEFEKDMAKKLGLGDMMMPEAKLGTASRK